MREIKFRQAIIFDDKFHHWHYWGFLEGEFIGVASLKVPNYQYTGLKDKNGKEGYFDDLVRWGKAIYRVVWNEEEGIATLQHVSGREVWKYLRISEIKKSVVIGNIHDNPELLKEDKLDSK